MSGLSSRPARRCSAWSARPGIAPPSMPILSATWSSLTCALRSWLRRFRQRWKWPARDVSSFGRTSLSRLYGCDGGAILRPLPTAEPMDTRMNVVALRAPEPAQEPDHAEAVRIAEALLFAAAEPLGREELLGRLPEGTDVDAVLAELRDLYAGRGVNLVQVAGKWAFRTAGDLSFLLARDVVEPRRLSRAAMETLAITAYHQPVTRAEIEEIRGVATSKGTLDLLLETGWIRLRGRRKAPGRPVTYGTTPAFLSHFGLDAIDDLPGLEELKGAGLLEGRLPPGLAVPSPSDDMTLRDDEDPLDDDLFAPLDVGDDTSERTDR